jgi:predicted esterase
MRFIIVICLLATFGSAKTSAQVKSSYLYNTAMPYGTLDLRTTISSTNYYYLSEGKTFAYRESSPGVKTNKYRDMTSWESNPYLQGHMRHKNGTSDKYVMNYRLLLPLNYSATSSGYPMIVFMHGGGERGNCFYNSCFHADWNYEPNANYPKAPTTVDHKLLNNDYQLSIGGKQHLDARNGGKFNGFVLACQMFNEWNPAEVEKVIKIIRLLCTKYKIDQNRIYIHGLSIGGYASYEAVKRAPWLFAAALPMSANKDANIVAEGLSKVIHISFWMFQGGTDTNPTPAYTKNIVTQLQNAGAIVKYTEYATLGHAIWNNAYADPTFFSWMNSKNISNLHAYKGIKTINKAKNIYPKLILPLGFFAYQWQKNGVTLSNVSNSMTITTPGVYRARFSRVANPTSTQWNRWSANVTINETTTASVTEPIVVENIRPDNPTVEVFPNPATSGDINIEYTGIENLRITLIDQFGRQIYQELLEPSQGTSTKLSVNTSLTDGLYILLIDDGERQFKKRVFIKN